MQLYLARKEQIVIAVLLLAILSALVVMSYAYGARQQRRVAAPFYVPAQEPAADTVEKLMVHVAGAVKTPGVYQCAEGTRITDAIKLAGGARADGCPDALNLAAKVNDGDKIYLPTRAEWEKLSAQQGPPPLVQPGSPRAGTSTAKSDEATRAASGPKEPPKGKISLNTATKEQLMLVPGIGEATAQRILDYRAQHGNFAAVADILNIEGIGEKRLAKMEPYLTL